MWIGRRVAKSSWRPFPYSRIKDHRRAQWIVEAGQSIGDAYATERLIREAMAIRVDNDSCCGEVVDDRIRPHAIVLHRVSREKMPVKGLHRYGGSSHRFPHANPV